jgi:AraC family transcriptional regulator, alkane utilization regulator
MREAPLHMTRKLFCPASPQAPAALVTLSDALRVVRASGALLLRGELSAPWTLAVPESAAMGRLVQAGGARVVFLHLVADGRCWVSLDGGEREVLEPGDAVLLPRGDAHLLGWGETAPVPIATVLPPAPSVEVPVLRWGGGGPLTRLVCCYLRCDDLLFNPFLDDLPPLLHLRAEDPSAAAWFRASANYIVAETGRSGPGCSVITGRLTELLFLEVLRVQMCRMAEGGVGWLAALCDEFVSRALQAFHAHPAHPWTLAAIARHVGLSRSAVVERFHRVLAQAPMQYLTAWRLQLAAHRLQATSHTLAAIASDVGYGSEAALSHAFKRATGVSPVAWRRSRRATRGD